MLSIVTDIPRFVLSSKLEIIIKSDKQITFSLYYNTTCILQETYTPDSNNLIHILYLSSLVEPYIQISLLDIFSYSCSANGETSLGKSFVVLYANCLIPGDDVYFINNYFLTTLVGHEKITSFNRKETLYLTTGKMGSEDESIVVSAECSYVNDNNKLYTSTVSLGEVRDYGIESIDVSPSKFDISGYKLLRYTIIAGTRRQTFRIDHAEPDSIGIKFRNSFGCLETFYFIGTDKLEPELTRSAAYFNGTYRTYHIDEQRKHTLSTGYIPESMFTLVDDVARSQEVYLMDESEEIPITIIDSDTQRDTSNDGLFSFTITYILSSRCQNRLKLLPDIFDDTFDDTYN